VLDPLALSFFLADSLQYEALRRVHLIPPEDTPVSSEDSLNVNVFRDLDSAVSEGGDNFSTGSEVSILLSAQNLISLQRESNSYAWHGQS
jgi:hypothetical protein